MGRMVRVGVVGLHHERIWRHVESACAMPYAEVVAGADPDYQARRRFAEVSGLPEEALYEEGRALLADREVDAVISGLPTNEHALLVELCAERNVAVMLEQPMAGSLDDVDRIVTAVQRTHLPFMVNFPRLWGRAVREAARMVMAGAVGHLIEVRYRVCEPRSGWREDADPFDKWLYDGGSSSAGAVMQLCSCGAQLASWLMGLPTSVIGVGGTIDSKDAEVNDNGILVMKYPEAFAVAEGSWTGLRGAGHASPEFHGSLGSLTVAGSALHFVDRQHPEGKTVTPDPPPAGRSSGVEHFLYSLHRGTDFAPSCDLATSRAAQETLEGGRRSIETGFECPLPVR